MDQANPEGMLIPRVIPCLLLRNKGLVKTMKFRDPKYLGDPINVVRIFNEKEVDELIFLDIDATVEDRQPPFTLLSRISGECFMPLGYGGGVKTIEDIERIFGIGIEKVSINTHAVENPGFIRRAADLFGSQSIVVSLDVKKDTLGKYRVYTHGGRRRTDLDPVDCALQMEQNGAGEILLNSIDRDGTMKGYDLGLIRQVSSKLTIPLIACGGAGSVADLMKAVKEGGASSAAAGSIFVFYGKHRSVLINYPSQSELQQAFS